MMRGAKRRFAYRLAITLGILNVERDIFKGLTAKQFAEWERYEHLEPFGRERGDYQAALISQTIANVHRGEKQSAYSLEDFLLKFGQEPKPPQTLEEQERILRMYAASFRKQE